MKFHLPKILFREPKAQRGFLISLLLLMLTGCGMLDKTSDTLDNFNDEYGDDIMQAIDDLQNAEYLDGPFENNLESARKYLLTQMQEKYGIEFSVAGRENLKNYGPFHGATYSCEVSPVEAPEQIATAVVSQTDCQDVRDDYAIYYFEEDAVAPVLALCGTKDYVTDQRISLEMPETEKRWTAEDKLEQFLSESGAYVKLVLRFTDDLDTETYAEYLYDFLNSVDRLECNLLLQAKANKVYIFHEELNILDGFDASRYSVKDLKQEIETFLSMGAPE